MFNLLNIPLPDFEQLGFDKVQKPELFTDIDYGGAQFDLTLIVEDFPDDRRVILNYNSDLFRRETISRMLGHYLNLLEAVTDHPEERIDKLPLLSQRERDLLLGEWNSTQASYPLEMSISACFEAQVAITPHSIAVVDGNQQITYEQLNNRSNQLAHYLRDHGVGNKTLVGVCLPRSIRYGCRAPWDPESWCGIPTPGSQLSPEAFVFHDG